MHLYLVTTETRKSASHSNSKYETRSTKQIQNWSFGLPTLRAGPQFRILKCSKRDFSARVVCCFGHLDFSNWNLFRISDLQQICSLWNKLGSIREQIRLEVAKGKSLDHLQLGRGRLKLGEVTKYVRRRIHLLTSILW